jgi:hypothetical protein
VVDEESGTTVVGVMQPWMELRLGQPLGLNQIGYHGFRFGDTCYYLPLGWHGWTVARRVSLAHDHLAHTVTVINHRLKWYIGDQWPTRRPWADLCGYLPDPDLVRAAVEPKALKKGKRGNKRRRRRRSEEEEAYEDDDDDATTAVMDDDNDNQEGDWNCVVCDGHQSACHTHCPRCRMPRPTPEALLIYEAKKKHGHRPAE